LSQLFILGEVMQNVKNRLPRSLTQIPKPCEFFDIIGGRGAGG